jgi:hypothetical protein
MEKWRGMTHQSNGFQCSVCQLWHDALPLSYSVKVPLAVNGIPEDELLRRVVFTADQCIVDERQFYLRGRIPVPVLGQDEPFIWGVWASVSQKDFLRTNELWNVSGREAEPPFLGRLNSEIPLYGDTLNLPVRVRTQIVGRRPHFEVLDAVHPLAMEQREGISLQRVCEIAEAILHPKS